MGAPPAPGVSVSAGTFRTGAVVAVGGEGSVQLVIDRPGFVYKAYRKPVPARPLVDLVAWPGLAFGAEGGDPLGERVARAAAWPTAVVVDPRDPSVAAGVLMPRAPRRFTVRHRDGRSRPASLSYLTADPARRHAAYGIDLPAPAAPDRFGLVYALARLLEAFDSGAARIVHGDLSAKNVLWSTQRGPEVFVLDCDSSERFDDAGRLLGPPDRRRAMTPNWEDPHAPTGASPGPHADRYSIALIFLRIVGAGHYPLQKRQRQGGAMTVELALPAARLRLPVLGPGGPIWRLCGQGLSVDEAEHRPSAAAWADVLADILDAMGAADLRRAVDANQAPLRAGTVLAGRPSSLRAPAPLPSASEVTVRPVPEEGRSRVWQVALPAVAPIGTPTRPVVVAPPIPGARQEVARVLRLAAAWWLRTHRRTGRALRTTGQRGRGLRRLVGCILVDFVTAAVGLFVVAMVVSPFLGI